MTDEHVPDIAIATVRTLAYELYAKIQHKWDPTLTEAEFLEELIKYSPTAFDEVREAHDHHLYIFHPSIGDEAGYWTLYVVADYWIGYGTATIMSMWQVFDTRPTALYEVEDEKPEGLEYSIPKGRFLV